MADDTVDLRFLGRQVQTLQGDVRDLRADHLRLESDVAGIRADITRMQGENEAAFEGMNVRFEQLQSEMRTGFRVVDARLESVDARLESVDARLDQVNQTMATNLQVMLAAIKG